MHFLVTPASPSLILILPWRPSPGEYFFPFSFLCSLCCALPPFFPSWSPWLLGFLSFCKEINRKCRRPSPRTLGRTVGRSLLSWWTVLLPLARGSPSPHISMLRAGFSVEPISACITREIKPTVSTIVLVFHFTGNKIANLLTERALARLNHKPHRRRKSHMAVPSNNASHRPIQTCAHFRYF